MIDLNEVAVFTKVAEAGNFTRAAKLLGLPRATVSRKVSRLEDELGVRLLQRTTRKLSLTDAGREYYLNCSNALAEIKHANEQITESQQSPSGVLRIAAPLASQRGFMSDWITEFLLLHENITAEISLSDDMVDLIEDRIDIAFRAGKLEDSSLIARQLGETQLVLCASPDYLKGSPEIHGIKDLKHHTGILFGIGGEAKAWRLGKTRRKHIVQMKARVVVNSMEFAINACLKGLGIALLPVPMISDYIANNDLQLVLKDYASETGGLYVIYPSRHHLSATAKAFLDFVRVKKDAGLPWDKLIV
jgi:DNA-binding transcriptional LysR family regulator